MEQDRYFNAVNVLVADNFDQPESNHYVCKHCNATFQEDQSREMWEDWEDTLFPHLEEQHSEIADGVSIAVRAGITW